MIYAITGTREQDTKWDVAHALHSWCISVGLECELVSCPSKMKVPKSTVLVWGWRLGKQLHKLGYRVLVMERGYIGDRMNTWTSIAEGGLNGRGKFHGPFSKDRFSKHHEHLYKPWNTDGEGVLIIGQTPGDQSLDGVDPLNWADQVCRKISLNKKMRGMPVFYRPHPNVSARGDFRCPKGATLSPKEYTLEQAITNAALVITYSSTSAVESLLSGKPTIAQGECSMAFGFAPASLDDPWHNEPDNRRGWAEMLACKQWTLDEIKSGLPFQFLQDQYRV